MRVYRVEYRNSDGSQGFSFHASRNEAKKSALDFLCSNAPEDEAPTSISRLDVRVRREGVLRALNTYGSHNDNG